MRKISLSLSFFFLAVTILAQQKPAYILYNAKGQQITYKKMLKTLQQKDIVLFGEFHNNAIAHWLQLEVTKDCDATRDLVLGAEMFEQDNQQALDLYLQGKITAKGLDSMARLWKNYPTDYAPLVNYAKENKIAFAATNIPRRYASLVSKGGFETLDTLSAQAKTWIAPLPIAYDAELPGYKKIKEMMAGHGGDNMPKAQASKDATMAHFILRYYQPGKLFIHYNGAFHSENYEGILWYLKKQQPELKYATITTVSQKDIHSLLAENKGKADFIICVDEDMTNTY
ncbi:MAG: ChaN family lipoprotein [Chitinophagaceae bacterium]|nr:ChaN family lipoprotein [Chitinophagaceae bacterium]HQV59725.1 ChaN family lipoprotein [Chitinophagaceae bacterium]HQV85839.1 ChaN family lipoprotein [Chitinophagaceae bacterium]HQX71639.1 ChaN family lipoprotein [Chitinophagaceae bacterium]HQZ72951.1 ChaN family lipoprotein [Chitinophagaceae bacterium]